MRKTLFALAMVAMLAVPSLAEAQFGIAARGGTLGVGGEVALEVGNSLVLRGGMSFMPLEIDATDFWEVGNDVEATLTLPEKWYNIGADLYLGSSFRIGAGMLFKPDDFTVTGTVEGSASIEIGGQTYSASEVGEVSGGLVTKDRAPYVLIGFGKHTSSGVGLFLDMGLAMTGEPVVELNATGGPIISSTDFQNRLRAEEASLQADVPSFLKYWPILNIGIKIGVGN